MAQPTGQWIRTDKRLAIYLRDAFRCLYCDADLHGVDPQNITLDHIIPGGPNTETNLVVACRHCNCSRKDTPFEKFASAKVISEVHYRLYRPLKGFLAMARAILSGTVGLEPTVALVRS